MPFADYTVHNIVSRSTFAVSVGQTDATAFPGTIDGLPAVPQLVVFAVKFSSDFLFICQSTSGLRPYTPVKFLSSTFVVGVTVNTQVYYVKGVIDDKTFSLFQPPSSSGNLLSGGLTGVTISTNNGNCDIFYFNNGAVCKKAVVVVPYAGQINIASVDSAASILFSSSFFPAVIGSPIVFQPNFFTLSPLSRGLFVVGSFRPEVPYFISSSSSRKITVTGAKLTHVYVSTASHFTECQKIRFSSNFGSLPVVALNDYFIKQILHDGAIQISSSCASAALQVDATAAGLLISSSFPLIYSVDAYSQSFDLYSYYQISEKQSETIPPVLVNTFVVSKRQNNVFELDSSSSTSGIIQGLKIGSSVMFSGPLMRGISRFGKYRIDQLQSSPDAFSIQYDTGKGVLVTSYNSNVFTCTSTFDYRSGDVVYFAGISFASSISVMPGDMYVIQAITSATTFQLLQRDATSCISGVYSGACIKMIGPTLVQAGTGQAAANEALYMRRALKLSFVNLDVSACTTTELSCLRQAPERMDAATMYCAEVLTIGAKVRFSGTPIAGKLLGGLIPSTDYYISSTINGSAFTISTSAGNGMYTPFALTPTAFSRCIVTSITLANLKCEATVAVTGRNARGLFTASTSLTSFTVGQQVVFTTGGTFFGGVYGTVVYYIRSIEGDTLFTVSATDDGNVIHDGTISSGSMIMTASPFKASKFSVGSRVRFFARERSTFTAVAGFAASTTYYITKISKVTNVFSVSTSEGGTDISVSSATPGWIMMTWSDTTMSLESTDSTSDSTSKMNVRFGKSSIVGNFDASIGSMTISPKDQDFNADKESTIFGRSDLKRVVSCTSSLVLFDTGSSFDVGDSLIFTGGFGNIVASRPYFIKSLSFVSVSSASVNVELSTHPGAPTFAVASGALTPVDIFAYSTNPQHSIQCTTSSASTQSLTCSSLSNFFVSETVVCVYNTGTVDFVGIDAGSVYFIRKIISNSHVVLSTSANGPAVALSDATGSVTITKASSSNFFVASCTSTSLICNSPRCALFLKVSNPVVFEKTVICGIVAGNTYYVHSIVNPTEFSISTSIGSTAPFLLTVASGGSMPFYMSTGVIHKDFSNFQRHLVPFDRNSQVRITNQRPLSAAGCAACKISRSALMCSPRGVRNSKNSLETTASNSTVSVGTLEEFTLEASFLFYDCTIGANQQQIVFGRDGMKIKVGLHSISSFVLFQHNYCCAKLELIFYTVWNHIVVHDRVHADAVISRQHK